RYVTWKSAIVMRHSFNWLSTTARSRACSAEMVHRSLSLVNSWNSTSRPWSRVWLVQDAHRIEFLFPVSGTALLPFSLRERRSERRTIPVTSRERGVELIGRRQAREKAHR